MQLPLLLIFLRRIKAGAILHRIQIMVPNNNRSGIPLMQFCYQPPECSLLLWGAGICFFPQGVQSALITHSDRVFVVVQAVGTHKPFRSSWLNLSVTTDNVVVADAKLVMAVFSVPRVNLSCRTLLVGAYCRAVDNDQSNGPHDCTAMVPNTVVITVATYFTTMITFLQFTFFIVCNFFVLHFFYCSVLFCIVLYCSVLFSIVQYCSVLFNCICNAVGNNIGICNAVGIANPQIKSSGITNPAERGERGENFWCASLPSQGGEL